MHIDVFWHIAVLAFLTTLNLGKVMYLEQIPNFHWAVLRPRQNNVPHVHMSISKYVNYPNDTSAVMVTRHVAASGRREADVHNSDIVPGEKERERRWEVMERGRANGFDPYLTPYSHTLFLPCLPTHTVLVYDASLNNPQRPTVVKLQQQLNYSIFV